MSKLKIYALVTLVSILGIGTLAVRARYQSEISAAQAAIDRLGSQVIETNCGPIEYARVGNGYPVLAIHGTFGGFDAGLQLAQPAIEAGYQVISISRFGYLRTPMPENASVDMQADAFACLLDALGVQQVAVMTVSGGAVSSIRFAARYPERVSALVMTSPSAPGDVHVAPPPEAAFALTRSNFLYWALITYANGIGPKMIGVPNSVVLTLPFKDEVASILSTTLPSRDRTDGFYFDNYKVTKEFYEEISESSPYAVDKIKAPVLVINALDDPIAVHENVRSLAERFPNARLYLVPDGGHVLLGHSKEVNTAVIQFLHSQVTVR